MTVTLDSLVEDVEQRAPSPEPLALLATASATVVELNETTDALLSHFVDRSRRAGHSWSEIGEALGVTKQAVQKRFTGEKQLVPGSELFTPRVRKVMSKHAERAAKELGQPLVGTEALLLALMDEPDGLAAKALEEAGVDREQVAAALRPLLPAPGVYTGGYTSQAWTAMESCSMIAAQMGHNYVGTEHLLVSLLSMDADAVATKALKKLGVKIEPTAAYIKKLLGTP